MFERFKEWRRSRFHLKARRLYGAHRLTSAQLDVAHDNQQHTHQVQEYIHARQEARIESAKATIKDPRLQDKAVEATQSTRAKLEPLFEQDRQEAAQRVEGRQKDYDKELKKATKHYKRNQEKYYDAAVESMQEAGLELKAKITSDKKDTDTPINPGIKVG